MLKVGIPHKSTRSGPAGHCVEATLQADGAVRVLDTKHRNRGYLEFTPDEWFAFLAGAKDGEFDLP